MRTLPFQASQFSLVKLSRFYASEFRDVVLDLNEPADC